MKIMYDTSEEFVSRVLIKIEGGFIESVKKDPFVKVEIRDYDIDFMDNEDIFYDEEGIGYIERYNE